MHEDVSVPRGGPATVREAGNCLPDVSPLRAVRKTLRLRSGQAFALTRLFVARVTLAPALQVQVLSLTLRSVFLVVTMGVPWQAVYRVGSGQTTGNRKQRARKTCQRRRLPRRRISRADNG
jgi:hypothetical protein